MTPLVVAGMVLLGVLTAGFVLYPVLRASSASGEVHLHSPESGDRLAELLARRDAVYEAIRDAEFDRETGKLTAEDYQLMRQRLTAEGVRLLQELDQVMQSDVREELEQEIEAEVAALRRRRGREPAAAHDLPAPAGLAAARAGAVASDGHTFVRCPACNNRVRADAQFCTHCGIALTLTCPECDARVSAEDRFCSRCGTALSPVAATASLEGRTGQSGRSDS